MMGTIPRVLALPAMHVLKSLSGGRVDKDNLWRVVPLALVEMSDDQCERGIKVIRQFLDELSEDANG